MESYEQKYREALGRMMESLYGGLYGGLHGKTKEEAEKYFTELKESEDERVKKELIELISCMHDADPRKKGWIAWLEKQGETFTKKDVEDAYLQGVCDAKQELEKQGEPFDDNIITRDDEILQAISIGLTDAEKDLGWSDFGGLPIEEIHAWLEKQGDDGWGEGDVVRHGGILALVTNGRNAIKSNLEQITIQYPDEWVKAHTKERKYFFDELEKQGKKPQGKTALEAAKEEKSPVETLGISPEEYERMVNECIYGESTDKLKPKFKVGDWVVSKTSNLVYHVDSILLPQSKCYYLSHDGGLVIVSFTDEQNYHLWTIQDAKDGDVLTTQGSVFIFKHLDKTGRSLCKSYCEVIDNSGLGLGFEFSINGVCPATKEQCDLLFAKMKEAGYEWDAEKKELKRLENQGEKKPINDGILAAINFNELFQNCKLPKFNVGDYIVHNTANFVFKIINIGSNGYEVINRESNKKTISFYNEDNYHLWTIEDVKPGDVLVYDNSAVEIILLFKEWQHGYIGAADTYVHVYNNNIKINNWCDCSYDAHLATKEQCDFLFQKMHKAGYEWDSNNKELKRLENKDEQK